MRRLALTFVLAACGDHGVELSVSVPPEICADTTSCHVELLIAPDECREGHQVPHCDRGVAWDTATQKPDGKIFILNTDAIWTAPVDADRFARFRLDAVASESTIARLIVIGYHGKSVIGMSRLTDLSIPLPRGEAWQIHLDPPLRDIADQSHGGEDHVHIWERHDPAMSKCLVLQHPNDPAGELEFVVPPGDTDCDDEAIECDPFWAHYKSRADCVTLEGPIDPGTCTIGNNSCADGISAQGGTCVQLSQEVCMVSTICRDCPKFADDCVKGALDDAFNNGSDMMHVTCSYPYNAISGAPCTDNARDLGIIVLDPFMPTGACDLLQFIGASVPFGTPQPALTFGGLTFKPSRDSSMRCGFGIKFTAGMGSSTTMEQRGFLDFRVTTTQEHMLIPFQLGFEPIPGCPPAGTTTAICSLHQPGTTSETVFRCASQ